MAGIDSYTKLCLHMDIGDGGLTIGSATEYDANQSQYNHICRMDDTHAIVIYEDNGNSNYVTAVCLTYANGVITAGTPVQVDAVAPIYMDICGMDATHAVVCYSVPSTSGKAVCLSLSGTTITVNTAITFESASTTDISVCTLSSSAAVVTYTDAGNSSQGTACHLGLSGTTLTAQTPVVFETGSTASSSVAALSATDVIVGYQDVGNSSYGTACYLGISGTTITPATPVVVSSSGTAHIGVREISSSTMLMTYTASNGYAVVLSLSGTTITVGTPQVVQAAAIQYEAAVVMSATEAYVFYSVPTAGNEEYYAPLTLSGTSISVGTPVDFDGGPLLDAVKIDAYGIISAYAEKTTYAGTAKALYYAADFVDSSPSAHTVTPNGDAQISTAQSKFGGASGLFDGTGDYLSIPDSADFDFGTSNFCIDFWFRDNGTSVNYPSIVATGSGSWASGCFAIRYNNSGYSSKFTVHWNPEGDPLLVSSSTYATTTWHHVAVIRTGSTLYLFVNGTLQDSAAISNSLDLAFGGSVTVGTSIWDGAAGFITGNVDELRATKGRDRINDPRDPLYISSGDPADGFTPPTEAYSDIYMTYSSFPTRAEYVMWPSARFAARADAEEPARVYAAFTTRAIAKALREGAFPARISATVFREAAFTTRAVTKKYVESIFPTRKMAMYAPGWNVYVTDMSTNVTTFVGFVDAEGTPTISDVALADGSYELEAKPILNLWEDTTGGIRVPVTISTGNPIVTGAPDIIDLAGEYLDNGWTRLTWSISGQPTGSNPKFGVWRGSTPVNTSTAPETSVAYDEQVQVYRALVRQTVSTYFAVKYYSSTKTGTQSEVQVIVPASTLTAPTGVFPE